jgi:hypothetical protein
MKRIMSACTLFLAAGAFMLAQEQAKPPSHTETTVKQSGPGPDSKTKSESVTGVVKEYEAGKKIEIEGPGGKSYKFDLDENARVSGAIVKGQPARVEYWKDETGRERVRVLSEASRSAVAGATMPRSHTEAVEKRKYPDAADTKVKTETVIGVVKEYEAGKKLVVTGPNNKDFRFDLDEGAAITGPVAVGERVKVTFQKGDAGERVTVVARYTDKV